jgi:hypothetical protein
MRACSTIIIAQIHLSLLTKHSDLASKNKQLHMVEGKRLEVNRSATRYQRELAYLVSLL